MGIRVKALTDEEYGVIGRRHGSEDVAQEVSLAVTRWERDVEVLKGYGWGRKGLDAFKALAAQHAACMKDRPEGLAFKRTTVQGRDSTVSNGWAWVDRAVSILTPLARASAPVSNALHEAAPSDDAALAAGIGALGKVLQANLQSMDPDTQAQALLDEMPALVEAINAKPGAAKGSKEAAKEDTREVDLLDGKVYITMVDLNSAARKAFRNIKDSVKVKDYIFHVLKRSGARGNGGQPTQEAPPEPKA